MKLWTVVFFGCLSLVSACGGGGSGSDAGKAPQETTQSYIEGIGDLEPGVYLLYVGDSETREPVDDGILDVVAITGSGRTVGNLHYFNTPLRFGTARFTDEKNFVWSEKFISYRNLEVSEAQSTSSGIVLDAQTFKMEGIQDPGLDAFSEKVIDYTEPSISLDGLSNTYVGRHAFINDGRTASITIDSTGVLNGADDKGCVFNGEISNLDSNYRIFDVDFEAANCSGDQIPASQRNGTFTGVGILDEYGGQEILAIYAHNDEFAFAFSTYF